MKLRTTALAAAALAFSGCRSTPPPPVEAKAPAAPERAGEVVLDPAKQAKAGIVVAQAAIRSRNEAITAAGQLAPNEERTWRVGAMTTGRVVEVYANPGDSVRKGQVIARMHSHDVHEVRAAYQRALEDVRRSQAVEQQALRVRDRARRLFDLKASSREQVETAETEYRSAQAAVQNARTDLEKERIHLQDFLEVPVNDGGPRDPASDYVPVRAPAAGMVTERKATPGTVVSMGETLFTLTDTSSVWMIAAVSETDLGGLRPGQPAHIRVRAWPDERFPATVLRLGEQLDPTTRTLQVRLSVPNRGGRLKPEMYATAEIDRAATRSALFVPDSAVQELNGHKVVFISSARGRFSVRDVETGEHAGSDIEITAGLAPTEQIVVRGAFILKSQLLAKSLAEE